MRLFAPCSWNEKANDGGVSSGEETEDEDAFNALSYIGEAAYSVLRKRHNNHHHELWNVTRARMIGKVHTTPSDAFQRMDSEDPPEGLDDWFPEKIGEIIARTERWCDVMSLAPPDGLFLEAFQKALHDIVSKNEASLGCVTIRMMFGNIVGMPVNCNAIVQELTKDLPKNANNKLNLWVGSWRKGVSWNHAKIIAVDGKYLWTGGHNFWDAHYLKNNPVNDLSLEMEGGGAARDAHRFANTQWNFIVKKQSTRWGRFVDKRIPDALDLPSRARVAVSNFPEATTAEFPPVYTEEKQLAGQQRLSKGRNDTGGPEESSGSDSDLVPVITIGRYGTLLKKARPSDDAFVAMIESAKHIIHMSLQDIGPVCLPGTNIPLPGCVWPKAYLEALARVIWLRGVDVEIVLSNPNSIPGNLTPTEANYGNGWSCVDVAAEIIKTIQKLFPGAPDGDLRKKVEENLRICFVKSPRGGTEYSDGGTLGLHSKHFIVDDICCYIGSQNLYICDLAEWGVVIDNPLAVQKIMAEYWEPMWRVSYTSDDCEVDKVMDGLKIDRSAPSNMKLTKIQQIQAKERIHATTNVPTLSEFHQVSLQKKKNKKKTKSQKFKEDHDLLDVRSIEMSI